MKTLVLYTDYLLFVRGELKPQIGDKLFDISSKEYCEVNENDFECLKSTTIENYFSECYVEILYNPNEAIDFANFILNYKEKGGLSIIKNYKTSNKFAYNIIAEGDIDIEKLYKQFKTVNKL